MCLDMVKIGKVLDIYDNLLTQVINIIYVKHYWKAPVAEWLRLLILSALNRSSSYHCGFEPSSGHMWDKPSSACGWSGDFSRGSLIFTPSND